MNYSFKTLSTKYGFNMNICRERIAEKNFNKMRGLYDQFKDKSEKKRGNSKPMVLFLGMKIFEKIE